MSGREDDLAYGKYYQRDDGQGESTRGFVGDTFNKLRNTYKQHHSQSPPPGQNQPQSSYNPGGYGGQNFSPNQGAPQTYPYGTQGQNQNENQNPAYQEPGYQGKPAKQDKFSGLLGKFQDTVATLGTDVAQRLGTALDPQAYAQYGTPQPQSQQRFGSFAAPRQANDAKWYVDGCSYFYAVSKALESAKESIWILDWWLSPELYLRRPPAKNEQYRLDRMLHAAAQRGVRVNIIVYKEVTQALTLSSSHTKHALEDLHQNIAVFRHPDHLPDRQNLHSSITTTLQNLTLDTVSLAKMSGDALKGIYGMNEDVILYWAHHEKLCLIDGRIAFMGGLDMCFGRWDTHQHAIADVHPTNLDDIVFPGQDYNNARVLDFQDVVHWEKNQLNRERTSRMGWSDISVSLHGQVVEDLRRHFVERWNFIYDTKYQVRKDVRYSKLALYGRPSSSTSQQQSAANNQPQSQQQQQPHQPQYQQQSQPQYQQQHQPQQPADLSAYPPQTTVGGQGAPNYQPPSPGYGGQSPSQAQTGSHQYSYTGDSFPPPPPGPPPTQSYGSTPTQSYGSAQSPNQGQGQAPYFPPPPTQEGSHSQTRGMDDYYEGSRGQGDPDRSSFNPRRFKDEITGYGNVLRGQLAGQVHQYQDRLSSFGRPGPQQRGNMSCQIVRSCTKWSNGTPTEHSIADAYAAIIRNSEHFVYIENQFFITATGDSQKPVRNQIGAAIVERILRAARAGQKYKIIVVIPTVPCFAGDLEDEASLGTRAIMEFQYNSINRGGHSIMELIAKEGYNPMEYIRFYNLRNYDRINANSRMSEIEQKSGVSYEDARKQHDLNTVGPGGYGPGATRTAFDTSVPFQQQYQQAAHQVSTTKSTSGRWDSVSECYMLHGEDIRNVPWEGPSEAEIDAFVTEELYVHSKVMIADDRVVICGSANLNDRSQLGDHDSEIAVIIEDQTPVQSSMNGQPWTASRFAASLRRQLFRKHLGLLPPEDPQRPDANSEPVGVPNQFDFDAPESRIVADPLADTLQSLWNTRSRTNTEVFRKVFHAVPDDTVRDWASYREFYSYYFQGSDKQAYGKEEKDSRPSRFQYGHVVRDNFAPGAEGVREVKELLSQVKGTLVEMPLMFLIEEDVAKSGLALNELTEPLYT
ncbi:putative phospholipase D (PLD) [Aspergillus clavatus NRRL 1]|uniref:phospholipase D n=1 Tax=Aspergillus clavatus (strain ATCC 1007 / CBS 513.65 / DSM 816 / NCTC 3887 / NRRL 1 / QM 1276 / 107) TaxID=344612 RepID=A1C7Y4_ASPCL|nr:phospholipase D Active site motif protein [Aspergillus clavatus NRRL 1]EAW14505.1 phospholipase D Active site motif protein [Aspergillus clavatus NRRL 1]